MAKIESLENAPHDSMLINPAIPLADDDIYSDKAIVSTPGTVI